MTATAKYQIIADCGGDDSYVLEEYDHEPGAHELETWAASAEHNVRITTERYSVFTRHIQSIRIRRKLRP